MIPALLLLAAAPDPSRFALIIGVNTSVDAELPSLRYADDDAARYDELFTALGAQTEILARLDENTARLHPGVAKRAALPVDTELTAAVDRLAAALAQAQGPTELFVVYAGHGNLKNGDGYLTLEDARLTTAALADRVFDRLKAGRTHFIVDACYSSFLALSRGPGGTREKASGFSDAARLGHVGLLLSTASARESHEWEGFQAGVFSHEVRSGLHGAADADHDGRVSYREIAAFIERANAKILNEKYRPDVHVRAPDDAGVLVDLRGALARHLEVGGAEAAHWLLEDARGVRLLDFHNGAGTSVSLLRPETGGALYLRRPSDDREYALPEAPAVLQLAALKWQRPRVAGRGAAHDAFSLTFAEPFDAAAVSAWQAKDVTAPAVEPAWRKPVGIVGIALGLVGVGTGAGFTATAFSARLAPGASNAAAQLHNARVQELTGFATGLYVAGGVLTAAGLALLLSLLGG